MLPRTIAFRLACRRDSHVNLRCCCTPHRVLDEWSGQGLRTLVMGARELSEDEYAAWKQRLDAANASITNRAKLVDQLADELETNLVLVGATAIEDQLQDKVPDTIAYLRQAGVKVGDAAVVSSHRGNVTSSRVRRVCGCRCGC